MIKTTTFITLLAFVCSIGYAQVFIIDSLPKQGILLDKGWKWHAGDNPDFAKTDFDDSKWESIDPTKDIFNIPPIAKTGIGWLHLKLSLSKDLQKEQITLMIKQYVASEIYLNGSLIYKFGKISANPEEVLAYNPESLPVSVPINFSENQLLAIRYAFQSNLNFGVDASTHLPLLEVKIISSNDAFKQVSIKERHWQLTNTFRIGAFVILALLYLAFFFYNSSNKAYLFFFLFTIFEMPSDILQFNLPPEVQNLVFAFRFTNILWQISQLFLLTAMYLLQNQKRGWIYWSLVILSVLGIILNNWAFRELLVVNLISLELVRTCFKSLKLKTRGSWIISAGAVCFLFLMGSFYAGVFFNLSFTNIKLGESYTVLDVLYGAGQLCIPIATTIYVALDFGFTNHALKQKLIEVENLSQKTIAQENEKQQILSTQNQTLEKQVSERTNDLQHSLDKLKATQAQLIQSEKMASLGELTAGIAHEIQNPLNFVNNFSEVNNELIDEIIVDRSKKMEERSDKLQDELISNIKENSEKINQHGQRASSIVKGMLEHSRKSTGIKEPTDINKLCDEFVRLSYHGLRAKDKDFNCEFKLDLDPNLPKINVVSQDIGRVILNIVNNAFQACNEKSNNLAGLTRMNENNNLRGLSNIDENNNPASPAGRLRARLNDTVGQGLSNIDENINLASLSLPSDDDTNLADSSSAQAISNLQDYLPTVIVSTKNLIDKIEIRISDNGPGIPSHIKDKIFQPFFTTKPTGQGTGLGLSLAYDIVKAHRGEIIMNSNKIEGSPAAQAGTEFIIQLPI